MSSSPNHSLPNHPNSPASATPSTPPARTLISLDGRPLFEDNESMASLSLPVDPQQPSLSPADCRTLQKILHDVRSPSPLSPTPYFSDKPVNWLNLTVTPDSSTNKDKASCEDHELARGDERQDGYEDEDDSMELSDGEDAFGADEEDRDTIEDIMNMPGKTAPSVPVRDYSSLYAYDQPTPNRADELRLRRAPIEKSLEEQRRQQERVQAAAAAADGVYDVDVPIDGVSDHGLAVEEIRGLKVLHEEIKMHRVGGQQVATNAHNSSEASSSNHQAYISSSDVRRASEGIPLASDSFINFPSSACAVVQTPNGKHMDFTNSVPTPDPPVDNTFSYFEAREGEDISPSEHQRNVSSREKIAKLAREARVGEEEAAEQRELAELDQFRDMDLAPMEMVMEGGLAGDLIMCGTPIKARDEELLSRKTSDTSGSWIEDWNHTQRLQFSFPPPCRHNLLIEQDEEDDADVEESDTASSSKQQQLDVSPRRPTFVTIIGMLPAAIFWATIAPVIEGSSKVFDMVIEKLTGLKV